MAFQLSRRVVSKFGGTSMADAACMLRSAEICLQQASSVVVVSAASGTTNRLIELGKKAESGQWEEAETLLTLLREKHLEIARDLDASVEAKDAIELLLQEASSLGRGIFLLRDSSVKALDTLMSLGERLSSVLFVEALKLSQVRSQRQISVGVEWVDARKLIVTDEKYGRARPLLEQIRERCLKNLRLSEKGGAHWNLYVTQGFIGGTAEGSTTTLGRGGSDYSAALFAEAIDADILEIWTDVAGIASTDPRIDPTAQPLKEISFQEASELAIFGAKILHPATVAPAMRKNIPVFVGSSFAPEQAGTWIRREVQSRPLIRALALRKNQVLVTLSTPDMLQTHGFLFQIFKLFNEHKISIDAITTSEISVALTLDDSAVLNKNLITQLSQFAEVQVEEGLSLVSLIGNNINHTPGLAQNIFSVIAEINVRMICLGASKHNFCFLVSDSQGAHAIQKLHQFFIKSQH